MCTLLPIDTTAAHPHRRHRAAKYAEDDRCLNLAENLADPRVLIGQIGETGQYGAEIQATQDPWTGRNVTQRRWAKCTTGPVNRLRPLALANLSSERTHRRTNVRFTVFAAHEEPQTRQLLRNRRIQNRLNVDATFEQRTGQSRGAY